MQLKRKVCRHQLVIPLIQFWLDEPADESFAGGQKQCTSGQGLAAAGHRKKGDLKAGNDLNMKVFETKTILKTHPYLYLESTPHISTTNFLGWLKNSERSTSCSSSLTFIMVIIDSKLGYSLKQKWVSRNVSGLGIQFSPLPLKGKHPT